MLKVVALISSCFVLTGLCLGTPTEVIVDNLDLGFSVQGVDWEESGAVGEYNGSSLYTNTVGDSARWTPDLPEASPYEVWAWWASEAPGGWIYDRDSAADYTISYDGDVDTVVVDQDLNYGQWYLLGTYPFQSGTAGCVELVRDTDSGEATSADAVKFVLVPEPASLAILAIAGSVVLVRRKR